jgi:hypothetical protein
MPPVKLDKNGVFTVREWKSLTLVVATIYLLAGIVIISSFDLNSTSSYVNMLITVLCYLLFPAFVFRGKSFSRVDILRISQDGIYYYNRFITGWDNFHNAYVTNKMDVGSFQDKFELVLEYYRDDLLYQKKNRLTNTQDQSEEDIHAAIMYFNVNHLTVSAAGETPGGKEDKNANALSH